MDKLSSTEAGQYSEAANEVVNKPQIIIKKIQVESVPLNDYESEIETPKSHQSRGFSRETSKRFVDSRTASPMRQQAKRSLKSVIYTDSAVRNNPVAILESFVAFLSSRNRPSRRFSRIYLVTFPSSSEKRARA